MSTKDTIIKIINLPYSFYNLETVSIYSLLKGTDYFQFHDQINVDDISKELSNAPEVINNWLTWSENKRVDTGWFFEINNGQCRVGYVSAGKVTKTETYQDKIYACATFIKYEIESIRVC
ncbi:MAG: hypothetical protein ACTHJ8_02405 [Mucilaginibacter sp.]